MASLSESQKAIKCGKSDKAHSPSQPSPTALARRVSGYDMAYQSRVRDGSLASNARTDSSFPVKLHQLLSCCDGRIIRWQPKNDGKSFTIVNCEAFEAEMLPRLYSRANIEIFGQLLSLYGFQRMESGPFAGDYYHTMFIRDKPQLAHLIRKGGDAVGNPTSNPTAYLSVPSEMAESMAYSHSLASSMAASITARLRGLTFPGKLHYLLCHGVYDLALEGIMRWQPGGHAFAVHSSEEFEMQGLAAMLGTPGHASFRAQLFLHGFQRVRSEGPDVEAYYHTDFVREQPDLCRRIRSRNHLKSSLPTSSSSVVRQSLVTPLSGTSVKSTINTLRVPESLYLNPSRRPVHSVESKMNAMAKTICVDVAGSSESEGEHEKNEGVKQRKRPRIGQMMPQNYFPFKLHSLLTLAEKYGYQNILCWAPHGRCFLVNDKDLFSEHVLPLFRHSEFASFRAQLKAYGFVRICGNGPDKGAYHHGRFLRGKPELCATIIRRPKNVHGTIRGRPKGGQKKEPEFYKMKFLPDLDVEKTEAPAGDIKQLLETALTQITPPAVVTREIKAHSVEAGSDGDEGSDGQAIITSKNTDDVVAKLVKQNDNVDTPLPVKLHALLNDVHGHSFNAIVKWDDEGRSFSIWDEGVFGDILCAKWLNIPSLAAFETELFSYGFMRTQNGPHVGTYYHEMFLKDLPHLCRSMKKEENEQCQVPESDSSIESRHAIDNALYGAREGKVPLDSSLSTISCEYRGKRANSPELEIAVALTTMDELNAGGQSPTMYAADRCQVTPMHTVHIAEMSRGVGPFTPTMATCVPPAMVSPIAMKPRQQVVHKRRSLDPPASCDMLNSKVDKEEDESLKREREEPSGEANEVGAVNLKPNGDVATGDCNLDNKGRLSAMDMDSTNRTEEPSTEETRMHSCVSPSSEVVTYKVEQSSTQGSAETLSSSSSYSSEKEGSLSPEHSSRSSTPSQDLSREITVHEI